MNFLEDFGMKKPPYFYHFVALTLGFTLKLYLLKMEKVKNSRRNT